MTLATVTLLAFGASIVLVLSIDLIPIFKTRLGRINIGHWTGRREWSIGISTIAKKWIYKTPTVTLTDNRRLRIIDMLMGRHRRNSIQHWQQAALLLGLAEAERYSHDLSVGSCIAKFNSDVLVSGRWRSDPNEVDSAILAYALLESTQDTETIRSALDSVWDLLCQRIGNDGTVRYRLHMSDFRYVDTIGFICPFLVRYGQQFDVPEAVDLAIRQILAFDRAMLPGTSIPAHTYSTQTNLSSGLYGWGRGMGWYAIGLADSWHALDNAHPYKAELEGRVRRLARDVIALQGEHGGWRWNLTNSEAQADSSTTAMLAWFLARTSTLSDLHHEAAIARNRALNYLMSVTRRTGVVDFSQGDTKDIGVYSQRFDILPFTQGFAMRCAAADYLRTPTESEP